MSENDGFESFAPGEGPGRSPEQLSEEAKQRFAAAGAALQQIAKEEKNIQKKDDGIVDAILQFLNDDQKTHLSVLISRLCARNCPSIFLLCILSLINQHALAAVQQYLQEKQDEVQIAKEHAKGAELLLPGTLDSKTNLALVEWINHLQVILSRETATITLDHTLLQLSTFVLQEFLREHDMQIEYEKAAPLSASILQIIFEPFLKQEKGEVLE
ncbi:hypothetical protein A3D11_02495 [Candidatus Peribacteria bacterium RIFCSPHIGHO2_02_FULL_49_16]|nr:MAG: hypothetical protein A2880_02065 [Candidatus Peribacteria bacterium RIFCSPHIGHO2_01_FULL_49_38]OGJ58468.1 MAG: hypothetical protein A3D11_02495 [Candidatus Peribacteria bacterium RIFCSPHIGHO2_02_FULL_49_16]